MRTTTRFVLGLTAAGVVAASGSAYTQAITITPPNDEKLGYGTVTVAGVTASNIAYAPHASDGNKLASITFTITADGDGDATNNLAESSHDATLEFNAQGDASTQCSIDSAVLITCSWAANVAPAVSTAASIHLTVVPT